MDDLHYMQLAIGLAQSVKGQTSPNPPVGAVVVKNGEILGMGAHLKAGGPHAEVNALNMAGDEARGATIYVTLEPCSHQGKTPPCAEKIIESGIKRAVVATLDDHAVVSGRGIKRLQEAGVQTVVGMMEQEARALNDTFFHYIKKARPYVTLKTATSLDGKIATHTGESKWITGSESRADVHKDRHKHDAILVGIGTVLADNPHLTTRLPNGGKNPVRIILDSQLQTPIDANVITDQQAETWIFVGQGVTEAQQKRYEAFEQVKIFQQADVEQVSLSQMLDTLGQAEITTLYVEGGATINDAFVRAGLIDQFIFYIAPKLIGGRHAPTAISGVGFSRMQETIDLDIQSMTEVGHDIKIIATPKK